MTKQEYLKKVVDLQNKQTREMNLLHIAYAEANNPYKKGDIVFDHCNILKIKKWKVSIAGIHRDEVPTLVYEGIELKKNLEPKKVQRHTRMWQPNVLRHISGPETTFLGEEIEEKIRGVVYLCHYTGTELKVQNEMLFVSAGDALNAYSNIPNPESQIAYGKTKEAFEKELKALHKRMRDPKWVAQLKDYL